MNNKKHSNLNRDFDSGTRLLQSIFSHMHEGVLWVTEQGRITEANSVVLSLLGYSLKELQCLSIQDVVATDYHERLVASRERTLSGEDLPTVESRWIRKDGSTIFVEVWAENIADADGLTHGTIVGVNDLTQRRAAKSLLAESEDRYLQMYQHAPSGAFTVKNGLITQSNLVFQKLLKYSRGELQGKSFLDLYSSGPNGKELVLELMRVTPPGEDAPDVDVEMLRSDGETVWVRRTVRWGLAEDGLPEGVGIVIDMTKEKEAQAALEESEQRYRELYNNAPVAYIASKEGEILEANPKAAEVFGASQNELIGMNLMNLAADSPLGKEKFAAIIEANRRGIPLVNQRVEMRSVDGTPKWISLSGQPFLRPDGEIEGRGVYLDITEQVQLEEELEQARRRVQTIYDHMHEGVMWVDSQDRITQANPAAQSLLGYTIDDFQKLFLRDLFSPDDPEAIEGNRERGLIGEDTLPTEHRWVKKDGSVVPVQVWATTILDDNGIHYATILGVIDITRRKAARTQLVQAEKLAVIGQMVSGVAHELNNPLAGIWGLAELLTDKNLGIDANPQIAAIHREAGRCIRIVQNLLDFARPGLGVRVESDINAMVMSTIELKSYEFRAQNIEVKTDLEENLPKLDVDPHEFQQVILNLLTNAQQAILNSEVGTTISINTSFNSNQLYIEVADDGPGIDPIILERIFDPFFTTKEVGKGTGLGLSICFTTVGDMGGSITATNQTNGGATFIIQLPVEVTQRRTTVSAQSFEAL